MPIIRLFWGFRSNSINRSIEMRVYQMMLSDIIQNKIKSIPVLKWILAFSVFCILVFIPDVLGHSIVWIIHTFYESTSFILEEFLSHAFGFEKTLAQIIVFYFSIISGIGASFLIWRYYLKNYLYLKYSTYKYQVIDYWHNKQKIKKMKLILIRSVLMITVFMFLLS